MVGRLWLALACLIIIPWTVVAQQYTVTADSSKLNFDVTTSSGLVFTVKVSPVSTRGWLAITGVFNDGRLAEIDVLELRRIDTAGMDLVLLQSHLTPHEAASYDRAFTTAMDIRKAEKWGFPYFRGVAVLSTLLAENPPAISHASSTAFRLPRPPVSWTLNTLRGPLRFRLSLVDPTTIKAEIETKPSQ
jgi:hypothetical protein